MIMNASAASGLWFCVMFIVIVPLASLSAETAVTSGALPESFGGSVKELSELAACAAASANPAASARRASRRLIVACLSDRRPPDVRQYQSRGADTGQPLVLVQATR